MQPRRTAGSPLKVVFIGGRPRSGSTIVEMLLGQLPEVVAVGELCDLWRRGFVYNDHCSCGQPFQRCPRWNLVTGGHFDAFAGHPLHEIQRLWRSVLRVRRMPSLAWPAIAGRRYRADLKAYAAVVGELYRRITTEAGVKVVIDSSKEPSYGYFLHRVPGVEVHVVHLIRDSRAVAHSWTRKKKRGPGGGFMPTRSPRLSALEWDYYNLGVEACRRRAASYTRVRYEAFVEDPVPLLRSTSAVVGLGEPDLGFLEGNTAHVKALHAVGGNPVRFGGDRLTLRPDMAWREELAASDRRLVTALTWPLLMRYADRSWPNDELPALEGSDGRRA